MVEIWTALTAAEKVEAIIALVGVLLTASALGFAGYQFMLGVRQYGHEQRWRRKEYVAREYDRLATDPKAGAALLMLDWDSREIPLHQDRDGNPIMVRVDRKILGGALIPHDLPCRPQWDRREGAIRDCMDVLLERLGTFETMVEEGLIEQRDIAPYVEYWVGLIGDPKSRTVPKTIRNLWLYMERYGFDRAIRFVRRFGYPVTTTESDREQLERECREGFWGPPTFDMPASPIA